MKLGRKLSLKVLYLWQTARLRCYCGSGIVLDNNADDRSGVVELPTFEANAFSVGGKGERGNDFFLVFLLANLPRLLHDFVCQSYHIYVFPSFLPPSLEDLVAHNALEFSIVQVVEDSVRSSHNHVTRADVYPNKIRWL